MKKSIKFYNLYLRQAEARILNYTWVAAILNVFMR